MYQKDSIDLSDSFTTWFIQLHYYEQSIDYIMLIAANGINIINIWVRIENILKNTLVILKQCLKTKQSILKIMQSNTLNTIIVFEYQLWHYITHLNLN